jgi:DNA modification methylase
VYDGVTYTLRRVGAAARRPYCGPVYNLSVEGAHTFQTRVGMSHNTVKSATLMDYLIRLVTPPGGRVLDPFCGSGSTGIAAVRGGWKFIGVEREESYAEIASARIVHAARTLDPE